MAIKARSLLLSWADLRAVRRRLDIHMALGVLRVASEGRERIPEERCPCGSAHGYEEPSLSSNQATKVDAGWMSLPIPFARNTRCASSTLKKRERPTGHKAHSRSTCTKS
jgi:hypothetical protein